MDKLEYENFDYEGATIEEVEKKVDYEIANGLGGN